MSEDLGATGPGVLDDTTFSIIGDDDLTEIPPGLGNKYGSVATEVKICFCPITQVNNLDGFTKLISLILDNNSITDQNNFPAIPGLQTLWLNNNNILRLDFLLDDISKKYPNLTYLSLLKNPCCPNPLVGKATAEYRKYRLAVIAQFPHLKWLDSSQITKEEKDAALKEYQRVKRAPASEYQKSAAPSVVSESQGLNNVKTLTDDGAAFGKTRLLSYGNHSEGNRFITDL